jgi:DNA-binding CsgD family transcriptional regulator
MFVPGRDNARTGRRSVELHGRRRERDELDRFIKAVRDGDSRALVVCGEPGIGKTALLDYVAEHALGCRVVRAAGVQSEMELAFAGLHQLCVSILDRLDRVPPPQADALRTALGMAAGSAPDRFLLGLAVLNLLSDVAEERPVVCLIDDEQWLDRASAQVLSFVARRLGAESVGLIFGTRVLSSEHETLRGLLVEGLSRQDARALLDATLVWPLDERVRDQIVAETRGNPLALLELAHGLAPAKVAGGFGFPDAVSVSATIEATFERQIHALSSDARRLLQLAAADPVGDPVVIWKAAEQLGIGVDAATTAVEAGLVEFDARVQFRHPLVRSAAYRSASLKERQEIHRALAQATDPGVDPDRRAWHRAQATPSPNEEVAAELERSAGRAQARGGLPAAAAFVERAALLTPEPELRARRFLAAAAAKREAGELDEAVTLVTAAQSGMLDERSAAETERLRGGIAMDQGRFRDAAGLFLNAAKRLDTLDAAEARETHLQALETATWLDDVGNPGGMLAAAEAARQAPSGPQPPRLADIVLDAWATRLTLGHAAAAPIFADALKKLRDVSIGDDTGPSLWAAATSDTSSVVLELWDDATWYELGGRLERLARESGATVRLQFALNTLAWTRIFAGELDTARRLLEEDRLIAEATGNPPQAWTDAMLAAWRGREVEASAALDTLAQLAAALNFGAWMSVARVASSVLFNGLARHDDAREAAHAVLERESVGHQFAVFELAEAASHVGDEKAVATTLEWMSERARTAGTGWAFGTEAMIKALLAEGEDAERHYRDSIAHLGQSRMRPYLARTHLLYGEWLRRERRRVDAREQLRIAYEMLSGMGIDAFAERARRELMATGVTTGRRTVETSHTLTPQESHIARLARDGLSNPEIGSRLFISARTVKYHLSKVYTKLSITSREQLGSVLPAETVAGST